MKRTIIILGFIIFCTSLLIAQTKPHFEYVKKGMHYYKVRVLDSDTCIVYQMVKKEPPAYAFREKGWYNETSVGLMFGNNNAYEEKETRIIVSNSTGYHFNKLLGVGLGTGYASFSEDSPEFVIPLYAEMKSYLLNRHISPVLTLRAGYGFAVQQGDRSTDSRTGGIHVYPSIGYRFGGGKDANFSLDFGFLYQRVSYEHRYRGFDWGDYVQAVDIGYKRWVIRAGLRL